MSAGRKDLNDRPTALYRHYDADGHLLYVGISVDPEAREKAHRTESAWVSRATSFTGTWYPSRAEAHAAERRAIAEEAPAFNRQTYGARRTARLAPGDQLVTMAVRLDRPDLDDIDALAHAEDRTRSQMMRMLLEERIEARRVEHGV